MSVKDISAAEFEPEVIQRSHQVPVIVDFWAPWCGPCRTLGPILEREVSALGGKVELKKVNTDENPELSRRYQIRGIPAVKAFRDGDEVGEFVGARDAGFIRQFLADLSPSKAKVALDKAARSLAAGELVEAEDLLVPLVDDAEVGSRAAYTLAEVYLLLGKTDEVRPLLEKIDPRSDEYAKVDSLERRLALVEAAAEHGGVEEARAAVEADPKDVAARYALGAALAAQGDYGPALEQLLEVVSRDRTYKDDGARKAMLALFDQLGPDHELTREYRRRLQVVT